ncbi:outer membrane lipoprotein-sorting protein [Photobacterium sp. TY1-4]|uniref:outer membrane lipoprotein-sorting protein n=1 Tax=Photobacterium sp. TY1-4 TaxID=2899122 RepID=UPI0021C1144E|nr:outer membrane lipoprotein-sorting protein [Photobacterium sp. TY1-4]UXI03764.1 outer membrane lipoprotein-sorting protein [Photobacterium sp. TY1-4]
MFWTGQLKRLGLALALSVVACGVSAQTGLSVDAVDALLQQADQYRQGSDAAKVVSVVTLYQDGELDKRRQYHIYNRPERESLVLFQSAAEAGQKMLMLGDNYWLLMPKSRRPIRITPMQKLLGEASVGDISTLTWSQDYQGQWVADTEVVSADGTQYAAQQLALTAKTSGASYARIELWLAQGSAFPLKANLYLRSGKLAKQAWFTQGVLDGKPRVVAMTLLDQIQSGKKTVIEYQQIVPMTLADKFYNPAYLSRNPVSEL